MSCAEVWSVTTSGMMPRPTIMGSTSAAFPTRPTESPRFAACASRIQRMASSKSAVILSQ